MAFTAEEFKILTEKTMLFLIIMDKTGKVHNVNTRTEILFSLPTKQIIGTSIFNFVLDDDELHFRKIISDLSNDSSQASDTFRFATLISEGVLSLKFDFIYHNDLIYASGIDMTEENEEHSALITLSKLTKTGAWYFNPAKNQIYWSKECYILHDLDPKTPITREKGVSYYSAESRERIESYLDDLIRTGKPYDYTEEITTEKGTKKWVRVLGKPVMHNKKVIFVNGTIADITERQNYIEKLKYNEETKNLALRGIRSGIFDHHFDINATYYSTDFKKMLGLPTNEDFISIDLLQKLVHPNDLEAAKKRHIEEIKKKGNHYINHYRLRNKEGIYKHYEIYGYRKKDKRGRTTRMIGNLINVNQRKINEKIIAENQNRLSAMVNNSFAYTVLLDIKGEILMADDTSLHIIKRDFGVDPMTTPTRFINVMPVNFKNHFADSFNETIQGKEIKKEIERVTNKGAAQWLEVKYIPIYNHKEEVTTILVSFHDITESKSAELAVKEAHIKEQELSNLKSNILANFSHEIRTPLNGIITISNILLSEEEEPEEKKKLLEYLDQSKNRLLKTINNLSHYSEMETIQNNLEYEEYDINYLVETSYREYRHIAATKNLTYSLELDESCPVATIDKNLFHIAINNIIHNAIKYTEKGTVSVTIKATKKKNTIAIIIKDTGIGIDKTNLKKIFDPFIQESIGLSRKYEGTGIGLSISRKYIEILGGKITINSTLNKGSEFIILIPKSL